jgi:hypothetical protein
LRFRFIPNHKRFTMQTRNVFGPAHCVISYGSLPILLPFFFRQNQQGNG